MVPQCIQGLTIGDVVYLKTAAADKQPGMVTGFSVRRGHALIGVTWGHKGETYHDVIELDDEYTSDYGCGYDDDDDDVGLRLVK